MCCLMFCLFEILDSFPRWLYSQFIDRITIWWQNLSVWGCSYILYSLSVMNTRLIIGKDAHAYCFISIAFVCRCIVSRRLVHSFTRIFYKVFIFETNITFFGYCTLHFWRNIRNVWSNAERMFRFRSGKRFLFTIKKCIRFFDGTSIVYNLGNTKIDREVSFIG